MRWSRLIPPQKHHHVDREKRKRRGLALQSFSCFLPSLRDNHATTKALVREQGQGLSRGGVCLNLTKLSIPELPFSFSLPVLSLSLPPLIMQENNDPTKRMSPVRQDETALAIMSLPSTSPASSTPTPASQPPARLTCQRPPPLHPTPQRLPLSRPTSQRPAPRHHTISTQARYQFGSFATITTSPSVTTATDICPPSTLRPREDPP